MVVVANGFYDHAVCVSFGLATGASGFIVYHLAFPTHSILLQLIVFKVDVSLAVLQDSVSPLSCAIKESFGKFRGLSHLQFVNGFVAVICKVKIRREAQMSLFLSPFEAPSGMAFGQ